MNSHFCMCQMKQRSRSRSEHSIAVLCESKLITETGRCEEEKSPKTASMAAIGELCANRDPVAFDSSSQVSRRL